MNDNSITPLSFEPLSIEEFRKTLFQIGEERYHHRHPFHLLMHEGKLTRGQLQAWALNRYYYQSHIPIKDAIILTRFNESPFRRNWRERIIKHDGRENEQGGIERWVKLAEATGLSRSRVISEQEVLPITRYSLQAYLNIVRDGTLIEAVASSLTELFAGALITLRIEKLKTHYSWLSESLDYFEHRVTEAPEEAQFAFDWVVQHSVTRSDQELACNALRAKCDLLWAMLDGLYYAYVVPGYPPPGAFRIES